MRRRGFLHALVAAMGLGLLARAARAFAEWNAPAFAAETESQALTDFFGDRAVEPSDRIAIEVLDLVEDGAVVPVRISTTLPQPQSITLLAEKNPNPLVAHFTLGPRCGAVIATRIKVAEPADIVGIVESGGQLYSARKFVTVIQGGCG